MRQVYDMTYRKEIEGEKVPNTDKLFKVVGSMQNIASSLNMITRLKKWRSAMEAIISNIKRSFNIFICNWKGWEHFQSKVLWSVLAYNFRVMTGLIVTSLKPATIVV